MSMFPVYLQTDRFGRRDMLPSNQRLVLGITPDGALTLLGQPNPSNNSLWNQPSIRNTNITDRDNFEINLDVHHYGPEDISVKTIDGFLIIAAGHEEKQDEYGWVKRQFTRRYALPEGVDIDAIESRLSSDGILTVTAPRVVTRNERTVPIVQTGPVRSQAEVVKPEMGDGESPEFFAATVQ